MKQKSASLTSLIIGVIVILFTIADIVSFSPLSALYNTTNVSLLLLGIFAVVVGLFLRKK